MGFVVNGLKIVQVFSYYASFSLSAISVLKLYIMHLFEKTKDGPTRGRRFENSLSIGHDRYTSTLVKDKAIPLQPLKGPEGSRRLRLPDFKTIGT
jgi:hypothetical protein